MKIKIIGCINRTELQLSKVPSLIYNFDLQTVYIWTFIWTQLWKLDSCCFCSKTVLKVILKCQKDYSQKFSVNSYNRW